MEKKYKVFIGIIVCLCISLSLTQFFRCIELNLKTNTSYEDIEFVEHFNKNDFSNILINNIDSSDDNIIQGRVATKNLILRSNTVCNYTSDSSYCLNNLYSNVYITDVNSSKWVVLLHGLTCKGSDMYTWFGPIYEYLGYNIIAPDLRGHGSTGGEVSLGYLDSLDVYDWIKDLNSNWTKYGVSVMPSTIIVQGHSMGAATTLQLATNPDIASANGNFPFTKNLTQLNVKGFIDGAGYTSISSIGAHIGNIQYTSSSPVLNNVLDSVIGDYLIEKYKIGLTSGNYDKYSNVFSRGRKFPVGSKVAIVHGSDDTVVPYKFANIVESNVSPGILVNNWNIQGVGHNPLSEGIYAEYAKMLYNFTKCVEDVNCTSINRS